jgi:hypothetical protein
MMLFALLFYAKGTTWADQILERGWQTVKFTAVFLQCSDHHWSDSQATQESMDKAVTN